MPGRTPENCCSRFPPGFEAWQKYRITKMGKCMKFKSDLMSSKISDIVYSIDVNGNFTYLNDSVKSIGYEPGELIHRHFSSILLDEDVSRIQRNLVLQKKETDASVSVENHGLFDERRTGERITRNLPVRVLPNSKISPDPVHCRVNASGFYDCPASDQKIFKGTVGIIRIFKATAEVVDLISSFYASVFRLVSSIKRTGAFGKLDSVADDYYKLIRVSGDPVFLLTHDGTILYGGISTALFLGYTQEEIAGTRISDYIFADDINIIENMLNISDRDYPVFESKCRVKSADGSWFPVNCRTTPVVDGSGRPLFIEFFMEFSNRNEVLDYRSENTPHSVEADNDTVNPEQSGRAVLRDDPEIFRYAPQNDWQWMTEMIDAAVLILKTSGVIKYVSRKITQLTGLMPEDITGTHLADLASDKHSTVLFDFLSGLTEKTLRDRSVPSPLNEKVVNLKKSDGSTVGVLLKCRPLFDDSGELIGFGVMAFKERGDGPSEKELIHSNTGETFKLFAGGIAHDFRNFLTSINTGIEMVKMDMDENHPHRESLFYAEKAVSMAADLASQLLHYTKNGIPAGNDASISEILHNTVSFALYGSNIKWRLLLYDDISGVLIDRSQLGRIILNLILNARRAISGKGLITICGEKIKIESGNADSMMTGNYIKLSVEDTGCGIPGKDIDRIFDIDYSTRDTGGGLGLAICKSIIEGNGGRIEVKSTVGSGTTFSILIPASDSSDNDKHN